jgi:hypothetical protein
MDEGVGVPLGVGDTPGFVVGVPACEVAVAAVLLALAAVAVAAFPTAAFADALDDALAFEDAWAFEDWTATSRSTAGWRGPGRRARRPLARATLRRGAPTPQGGPHAAVAAPLLAGVLAGPADCRRSPRRPAPAAPAGLRRWWPRDRAHPPRQPPRRAPPGSACPSSHTADSARLATRAHPERTRTRDRRWSCRCPPLHLLRSGDTPPADRCCTSPFACPRLPLSGAARGFWP